MDMAVQWRRRHGRPVALRDRTCGTLRAGGICSSARKIRLRLNLPDCCLFFTHKIALPMAGALTAATFWLLIILTAPGITLYFLPGSAARAYARIKKPLLLIPSGAVI